MGFNAIWISPVQTSAEGAYHGYWPINFYEINSNFGTEQDFLDLVKACHERDIWVMADVVANHIGYVQDLDKIKDIKNNDYTRTKPFDKPEYFHKLEIQCHDALDQGQNDDDTMDSCWLFYLPDLDQDISFVRETLLEWISWFVKKYEIDGLRLCSQTC